MTGRTRSSRRSFMKAAGAAGTFALVGCGSRSRAQPNGGDPPANPPALRVRKSASQLPPTDPVFQQYADAIRLMHELPESDPRSWARQARVHADRCAHGRAAFLHWHRHYLVFFERICGQLIKDPTFALPYWDWTHGTGIIPDPLFDRDPLNVAFWKDPSNYDSPVPTGWPGLIDTVGLRAIGKGFGVQSDPERGGNFTADNINSILGEPFERFWRRLEGSPHNTGHVVVGFPAQPPDGHMGAGLSSLDPLFWLHHCNVDRLWAQWQLAGNAMPDVDENYDGHFVDAAGKPAAGVTAAGAVRFADLGYTYEQFGDPNNFANIAAVPPPGAVPEAIQTRLLGRLDKIQPVEIATEASAPVPVPKLAEELTRRGASRETALPPLETIRARGLEKSMLRDFGKPVQRQRRIIARLREVVPDVDRNPVVNVFLNCPYLTPETPYRDPHYAGTFSFFQLPRPGGADAGAAGHAHHGQDEFYIDLTRPLARMNVADLNQLNVQLMALPPKDGAKVKGTIKVGSVEILSA